MIAVLSTGLTETQVSEILRDEKMLKFFFFAKGGYNGPKGLLYTFGEPINEVKKRFITWRNMCIAMKYYYLVLCSSLCFLQQWFFDDFSADQLRYVQLYVMKYFFIVTACKVLICAASLPMPCVEVL